MKENKKAPRCSIMKRRSVNAGQEDGNSMHSGGGIGRGWVEG